MYRVTVTEATRSRRTPPRSPAAAHYAAITADRPRAHRPPDYSLLAPGQMLAFARVGERSRDVFVYADAPDMSETWWERVRRWIAG